MNQLYHVPNVLELQHIVFLTLIYPLYVLDIRASLGY